MKCPPPRYAASLGRIQPRPMDVEATKQEGWKAMHLLVISPEDARLAAHERDLIRRIGERLYGSTRKGGAYG